MEKWMRSLNKYIEEKLMYYHYVRVMSQMK